MSKDLEEFCKAMDGEWDVESAIKEDERETQHRPACCYKFVKPSTGYVVERTGDVYAVVERTFTHDQDGENWTELPIAWFALEADAESMARQMCGCDVVVARPRKPTHHAGRMDGIFLGPERTR